MGCGASKAVDVARPKPAKTAAPAKVAAETINTSNQGGKPEVGLSYQAGTILLPLII